MATQSDIKIKLALDAGDVGRQANAAAQEVQAAMGKAAESASQVGAVVDGAMRRTGESVRQASSQLNLSAEKIKAASLMLVGAAAELAQKYNRANGAEMGAAGQYALGIGGKAAQYGGMGFALGGPWGAAIGAGVGAGVGALGTYWDRQGDERQREEGRARVNAEARRSVDGYVEQRGESKEQDAFYRRISDLVNGLGASGDAQNQQRGYGDAMAELASRKQELSALSGSTQLWLQSNDRAGNEQAFDEAFRELREFDAELAKITAAMGDLREAAATAAERQSAARYGDEIAQDSHDFGDQLSKLGIFAGGGIGGKEDYGRQQLDAQNAILSEVKQLAARGSAATWS